jgi:hypothetical protein
MDVPQPIDNRLAQIQGILDTAFFAPLFKNDWLAYRFGQTSFLRLEEPEVFDLFVRAALASEVIHPSQAEGRAPMAWLWDMDDSSAVLAHMLASLRFDRPLLFHRSLMSLSAVTRGEVKPEDFELVEDFLAKALSQSDLDLADAAASELETLYARAMRAAGQDPENPDPRLAELATEVLSKPQAAELESDSELRLWMALGDGLEGVPAELAPGVMAEAWAQWAGAIIGAPPNLALLGRMHPHLDLTAIELANHAPPEEGQSHQINASCPFCGLRSEIQLGPEIKPLSSCPHLIYVGTGDEVHLMEALSNFQVGEDFRELLASYYQSPSDLDLFCTIVNDLFEMLLNQGRLAAVPVASASAPQAFYNLLAFFQKPQNESPEEQPPQAH